MRLLRSSLVIVCAARIVLTSARAAAQAVDPAPPPRHLAPGRGAPPAPPPVRTHPRQEGAAQRLRQSAEAVTVVETHGAKKETADLGEVLGRTQGVSVRRTGGLGSAARFSLNGFQDDQIRFFLDGVPLERTAFPSGVANVPVNLVERVEIYRGVVPIRFGADALGGAVNLVTGDRDASRLAASYQVGSFGTRRVTLDGRYRDEESGFFAGGAAFLDSARNDYAVDVDITDARGRTVPARVRRFHDRYRAYGASVEAGFVDRPWARKLVLQGFASTYDKDLQNNVVMTIPYGEVTYGETVVGTTARYEQALRKGLELEVLASYARRTIDFVDDGVWVYDWFGRRVRRKSVGGEIGSNPIDERTIEDGGFGRLAVRWALAPHQELRGSITPTATVRTGRDRAQTDPSVPDPLGRPRTLVTIVSGLEHQLDLVDDDRLQNVAFLKDYVYHAAADELVTGKTFAARDRDLHAIGVGDAVRYRFSKWLSGKASYEYARRLPRPDEIFGNGVLVGPNLSLLSEVSHNANLGPRLELRKTPAGTFVVDVNTFLRQSENLIVLLGTQSGYRYENVYGARGIGLENAVSWSSPGRWLGLDATLSWQDVRNVSSEGTFGAFEGDRIPNRPNLFASWGGRIRLPDVAFPGSALEPFYHGRWVDEFFRAWESQGRREYKQVVDAQMTHDVGLSWIVERSLARMTSTLEIDNVTNARVFDFFGVQRPGRTLSLKVTAEL